MHLVINVKLAQRIRNTGVSYREVGIILAKMEGREVPYKATSVSKALHKAKAGTLKRDA